MTFVFGGPGDWLTLLSTVHAAARRAALYFQKDDRRRRRPWQHTANPPVFAHKPSPHLAATPHPTPLRPAFCLAAQANTKGAACTTPMPTWSSSKVSAPTWALVRLCPGGLLSTAWAAPVRAGPHTACTWFTLRRCAAHGRRCRAPCLPSCEAHSNRLRRWCNLTQQHPHRCLLPTPHPIQAWTTATLTRSSSTWGRRCRRWGSARWGASEAG